MSQVEVAKAIGVTPAALCRYEKGARKLPIDVAKRLGVLLDVDWWRLLDEISR
jgi:transcriptional regulator with XRE-family HTH domain